VVRIKVVLIAIITRDVESHPQFFTYSMSDS